MLGAPPQLWTWLTTRWCPVAGLGGVALVAGRVSRGGACRYGVAGPV
jgi:hypothetical protein